MSWASNTAYFLHRISDLCVHGTGPVMCEWWVRDQFYSSNCINNLEDGSNLGSLVSQFIAGQTALPWYLLHQKVHWVPGTVVCRVCCPLQLYTIVYCLYSLLLVVAASIF